MKSTSVKCIAILASAFFFSPIFATPFPLRPIETKAWQPSPIVWKERSTTQNGGRVDWANLSVPLDWNNPGGQQISLRMSRLPAHSDTSKCLFFNPGGPGSEVAKSTPEAYESYHQLRQEYHLIAVDPRGVGQSTPLQCNDTLWNELYSPHVKTEAGLKALVERNIALAESCQNLSGGIMYHMDTASVARDFEAVRQAVGDNKLNFFGMSYGTQIGIQYAELFPDKVGRFVLDGVVDHSGSREHGVSVPMEAMEKAFARFVEWCEGDPKCRFGGDGVFDKYGFDVATRYETLVEDADKDPLPAFGCDGIECSNTVTGEDIRAFAVGKLMWKEEWEELDYALYRAVNGEAFYLSPHASHVGNMDFVDRAVICLDWEHTPSNLSDVMKMEHLVASKGPHVQFRHSGVQYNQQFGCIGWPAATKNPPHRPKMDGVPPILLVNSLYDPATGYAWAASVHDQIPGSVLVTRDGDSHLSYRLRSEAAKIVDKFLLEGVLPQEDVTVGS